MFIIISGTWYCIQRMIGRVWLVILYKLCDIIRSDITRRLQHFRTHHAEQYLLRSWLTSSSVSQSKHLCLFPIKLICTPNYNFTLHAARKFLSNFLYSKICSLFDWMFFCSLNNYNTLWYTDIFTANIKYCHQRQAFFYCKFFWKWKSRRVEFKMACVERMASKPVGSKMGHAKKVLAETFAKISHLYYYQ